MKIFVDATTLIALGEVGKLDLLTSFDGDFCVLAPVADVVTTEPSASNLRNFRNRYMQFEAIGDSLFREVEEAREEAQQILDENEMNGDVAIFTKIIQLENKGIDSALVSDDRRLRTVAEGLGAQVTGTIGVVVRAVAEGELAEEDAEALVGRLDSRGLHMTGELRAKDDELIEDAANENGGED